jgi:steroid 5-alpha reductase family enzyme
VIPTLLFAGVLLGRWWRVSMPTLTIGWVALLWANGTVSGTADLAGTALIALANATVGVLVFQGLRLALHRASKQRRHPAPS